MIIIVWSLDFHISYLKLEDDPISVALKLCGVETNQFTLQVFMTSGRPMDLNRGSWCGCQEVNEQNAASQLDALAIRIVANPCICFMFAVFLSRNVSAMNYVQVRYDLFNIKFMGLAFLP